jgi:y4mF family transcriptional regulator
MKSVSQFIKTRRAKLKLTQAELARRTNVGLRFIRELEAGKETVRCDKVNKVLALFGCELAPQKSNITE